MNRSTLVLWTFGTLASLASAFALAWPASLQAAEPPAVAEPAPAKPLDKAALEKQFTELLSGCTLVGHYTEGAEKNEHEDHYSITKISKLKDDLWLFNARIEVEGHDVTLPIPIRVLWAGDTPVITLDELTIPGLGTFSARVLFHGHQYAGVWSHGDEGGQMAGRIEHEKDKDAK
jgi:hypothetical protein